MGLEEQERRRQKLSLQGEEDKVQEVDMVLEVVMDLEPEGEVVAVVEFLKQKLSKERREQRRVLGLLEMARVMELCWLLRGLEEQERKGQ